MNAVQLFLNGPFLFMLSSFTSTPPIMYCTIGKDGQNGLQIYKAMVFFIILFFQGGLESKLFLFFYYTDVFAGKKKPVVSVVFHHVVLLCNIRSGPACFIQAFDPFSCLKIAFFRWPVLPSPWLSRFKSGNTVKGCLCLLNDTVGKSRSLNAAAGLQSRPHWCWKSNLNQVFNQLVVRSHHLTFLPGRFLKVSVRFCTI